MNPLRPVSLKTGLKRPTVLNCMYTETRRNGLMER
ncbi:hypothetical protein T4B_7597 [Trichinella pseudospiralis]|uniref:Uncharacterized protein n=1 Tax=Trichinella pseudospiralis TaxID=6337 RepID=A0A0V1G901_TRIPS|nr:hypothetical protein T4B_7597 [Trichinella pseudospiralis]